MWRQPPRQDAGIDGEFARELIFRRVVFEPHGEVNVTSLLPVGVGVVLEVGSRLEGRPNQRVPGTMKLGV